MDGLMTCNFLYYFSHIMPMEGDNICLNATDMMPFTVEKIAVAVDISFPNANLASQGLTNI